MMAQLIGLSLVGVTTQKNSYVRCIKFLIILGNAYFQ